MNFVKYKLPHFTIVHGHFDYEIQGNQKVSVHLMITIQKVTSNVQSVSQQSPDIC
jgi:hypothetical protein